MTKLSAAIATFNEEENIGECLATIKDIADEIVIVDGSSTDRTVEIAKKYNASVLVTDNPKNFHINKQKSFELAKGDWILYLDADERVSKELAKEIRKVISMDNNELVEYQDNLKNRKLFLRHQRLLDLRDGPVGMEGEYVAFFLPRLNYFLGKYLRYGGVYPDGVIRLFKKDQAYLPCKDVHEQMVVKGRVGWLQENLLHFDSPNFSRYLKRNSRYVSLLAEEFREKNIGKTPFKFLEYFFVKPFWWFFVTQIRHKGILDGVQGIIFSFFSALRFPRAYLKYLKE